MAPGGRVLKRESTVAYGGLATPGASFYSGSGGAVTPKREIEEIDLSYLSDDSKEEPPTFRSHHGLPTDDGRSSVADRARRSDSVSARTSPHPLPSSHHTQAADMSLPIQSQGMEFVGRHVKTLVDALSDLRKYGLEHVVSLPELVLVGDQSAGKSSLMSALTDVQLPRDQGICTKCPANIKTSPAENWSCKVSLQQYYRYDKSRSKSILPKSVTQKNKFPPWVPQDLEVKEFMTLDHKSQLEEAIKWAQLALLNHDEDYTDFIPRQGRRAMMNTFEFERDNAEAKFSPNMIAIEISGPNLPALSFYDLPGIFRVAPDPKDQYLANVIQNLAEEFIRRPNALIIWTLAMKTDPSNSSTGKVIQDCQASDRCVGVLTNPDHVHARHVEYEKILEGKAHVVKHGYYVTRQPGDGASIPEGPTYHAQARRQEMDFFNSDPLWTGEWSQFRERCGTTAIQQFLSHELATQIITSLPDINQKIALRTAEVDRKLSECPDLPDSDLRAIISKILLEFGADARKVMNGESTDSVASFQSEWSILSGQFMKLIQYIKPGVTVSHPSDRSAPQKIEIDLLSDDDDDSIVDFGNGRKHRLPAQASPAPKRQRGNDLLAGPQTPVKRENFDQQVPSRASTMQSSPRRPGPFTNTDFERFAHLGRGFTNLDKIRKKINLHVRPGLPLLVDPETYSSLCVDSVKPWKGPLDVFIARTIEMVRNQLQSILHSYLGVYEQTELYRTARKYLDELIDEHATEEKSSLQELYQLEHYRCFTLNRDALNAHKEEEYKNLTAARKAARARVEVERQMRDDPKKKLSADISAEEREKTVKKRMDEIKDEQLKDTATFDEEIRVAAYVRGYYVTAALRFVDSVCLSIHGKFFRQIRENVKTFLEEKFRINSAEGEEICRKLMEEDSTIGRHRKELRAEKERLVGFSNRLAELVAKLEQGEDEPVSGLVGMNADAEYDNLALNYRRPSAADVEMGDGSEDTVVMVSE